MKKITTATTIWAGMHVVVEEMLGHLGHPKDSSASKTFWVYEVLLP